MPPFEIPYWLHYSCTGCGRCCRRGYDIWCPPKDYPRLREIDWGKKFPQLAGKQLFLPQPRGYRFGLDEQGACFFLTNDNLCLMHQAIGFDQKVLTCKIYPFNLVHSFGRVHVGLLFSCPAVVDQHGKAVQDQLPLLRKLLREMDELFPPPSFCEETEFTAGRMVSFRNLRFLEEALGQAMADTSLTLVRRVLWAAGILDRLERAADDHIHPKNFHETLIHHRDRAREEAENCGIARPRFGPFERLLLRQLLGFSTSLAEHGLTSTSLLKRQGARLRRLGLALRYLWGAGLVPAEGTRVTFDQVRAVQALHLPAESEALIGRYLRTRFASRAYFGQEGWGLPVLPGARLILTLPAVVIWHAKAMAAAAGRDAVMHADVREAVILVDNAFGHMAGLHTGMSQKALRVVSRAGWPERALLYAVLSE